MQEDPEHPYTCMYCIYHLPGAKKAQIYTVLLNVLLEFEYK